MLLGMRYILWARGHIRDLEDLVSGGRGHGDLEKWNCDISLRFGVLCRYLAFVAVDRSEKIDLDGKPHHVTQAVESPESWNMLLQSDLIFDDNIQCCVRAGKPRCIHMQYEPHESDNLYLLQMFTRPWAESAFRLLHRDVVVRYIGIQLAAANNRIFSLILFLKGNSYYLNFARK